MGCENGERSDPFGPWGPSAFFAGGCLVVSFPVLNLLRLPRISLVGGGVLCVVALVGFYSRRTVASPLTLGGGAATAAAALAFILAAVRGGMGLAGMLGVIRLPGELPSLIVVAYSALGAGLVLAGSRALRSSDTPRSVGLLLMGAGFSFPSVFLMESLCWNFPEWVLVNAYMILGVAVILVGVRLDAERVVGDGWVPSHSATTDDGTAGGWTNEYVRDKYDVDGSESRRGDPMVRRMQVQRIGYELAGPVWGWFARKLYPVRRAIGPVLNREATIEQAIAEDEYILTTIRATDRKGMGSPYWRLGMVYIVGMLLLGFGFVWACIGAVVIVTGRDIGPVLWSMVGVAGVWGAGGLATLASARETLQQLADRA